MWVVDTGSVPLSLEDAVGAPSTPRSYFAFGSFRLDPVNRVLFRDGEILPLSPKAIDTLLVLIEHRGAVVSKEELLNAVWPDTFVEEGSLTHNISLLRKVLVEDSGGRPCIETVPKRGYRFVAPLTEIVDVPERREARATALNQPHSGALRDAGERELGPFLLTEHLEGRTLERRVPLLRRWAFAGIAALAAAAVLVVAGIRLGWFQAEEPGRPPEVTLRQLTGGPLDHPVYIAAISPDGKYLTYGDQDGLYLRQVDTGEVHKLRTLDGMCFQ